MADPGAGFQEALGHTFTDEELFRRAVTHRSHLAEYPGGRSNERLEFLGDAVLQLCVTDYLYEHHPDLAEGELAKIRAAVVAEAPLARFAATFGLGAVLLLGRGEELTGGREKPSIVADAMEAVLGALYLDAGFAVAKEVVLRHWTPLIEDRAGAPGARDYKTRLQEVLAKDGLQPRYRIDEDGPDHAKRFEAVVSAAGRELGRGSGTSKKRAQQEAARAAMRALG